MWPPDMTKHVTCMHWENAKNKGKRNSSITLLFTCFPTDGPSEQSRGGFGLKEELVAHLRAAGHEVVDFGAHGLNPGDDYRIEPPNPQPSQAQAQ
jgi:hypothetical protein